MGKAIGVGILGGTGYGAGELLRLLSQHPEVSIVSVISRSKAGEAISSHHPHLLGFLDAAFDSELDLKSFDGFAQKVLFAALPHGTSCSLISERFAELKASGVKLIDLSGDFRLKSQSLHDAHYPGSKTASEVRDAFEYGATEINREVISKAQFVANPGCYALTSILAAAPVAAAEPSCSIAIDGKSGSSGAGRMPQQAFHHPETHANSWAYKVLSHRHEPEISQGLGDPNGERIDLSFVPHVIPSARGIYATAHIKVKNAASTEELRNMYRKFYSSSPFVRVREEAPELTAVVGSNFCDVSVFARGKTIVALAATDNLVKGMSGTAVQNMNLMCGLEETTGLWSPGLNLV